MGWKVGTGACLRRRWPERMRRAHEISVSLRRPRSLRASVSPGPPMPLRGRGFGCTEGAGAHGVAPSIGALSIAK